MDVKMFRAVNAEVVEKQFGPEILPGWFATPQEALANCRPIVENTPTVEAPDEAEQPVAVAPERKRGRPRKE